MQAAETPQAPGTTAAPSLRAERDRFVALAFCWAELLLELDEGQTVVFAGGAARTLLGRTTEELIGTKLTDLVAPADHALLNELMGIARKHGRIENATIRFQGTRGPTAPLSFAGYRLDDLKGHYFLALRTGTPARKSGAAGPLARDTESGLYDADAFAEVVAQHVEREPGEGEAESRMTLIELPDFEGLTERLAPEKERDLLNTVGACLRANSVDGDSAARLAGDRYGLIHAADVDVTALENQIADFAREVDPEQKGIEVRSASVEVDREAASPEDLANGLVYTINRFRSAKGADFTLESLSTSMSELVSQAVKSVNTFKNVVAANDFEVALQPILDVRTGEIHHYEALARFRSGKEGESPYEYITFAEETGLITEFDLAMAAKVVEWLSKTPRNSKSSVAVNVSGHSVASLGYLNGLDQLLNDNMWTRGRLLFEITESARMDDLDHADRFIQSLRQRGYPVCLDDFGAGAANFEYLSTLVVDVVKLDGPVVRNARKAQKGKAFLKALVSLCRDLGVETIAEMIDDEKGFKFVKDCGVEYVQGYLFGKPSTDVKAFQKMQMEYLFRGR